MPGSITQAAYYYQNHVAALKILELLEFGSPITSIFLENYEMGPHIDDIIVVHHNFTRYYQVKWSQNNNKPFTVSNLTPKEENVKSLLRQLAEGYNSPRVDKENTEIILYSTRDASNHKGHYKHGLHDFLDDIHTAFVASPLLSKLSELPSYSEYKSIINAWKIASGLDEVTFDKFLRHLRFELNQDDLQRQRQNIITKLALLGIDERLYDTLLNAVVEWSISGTAITKAEVLKKLGIALRLIDTVAHDYGVEKNHYVENTLLFEHLDKAIAYLQGGFILVDGPPGSGKSTALTVYQQTRPQVKFAYYCFVPHEIGPGNRRMEKETFLKSLCIGIKNAFLDMNFSQPYSEDYEAAIKELPRIINDETIDSYHEFLFEHISHNELTVWLLAILGRRKEYTTTAILLDILVLLNVQSNAHQVKQSLQTFKHLLKQVDVDMYDIFHNSFREFLLEKTNHLDHQINAALTDYYRSKLNSDESYRQFYRHLFELKKYDEILSHCNEEWLKQSWQDFRPLTEINSNIDIAWEAAIQLGSFKEFIRISFLKQQLAVIQNNLEAANGAHATFLLNIGKSKEAIRKVWDGELIQCALVEFSQFVLDYFKCTHELLPDRIISSGFSKSKGQLNPQEATIYYQSQALYFDWDKLFKEVDHTHWGKVKRPEDSLQPSSKETSDRINTSLKEKIIEVLFIAQKYEALLTIGQDRNIPHPLHNLAIINAIDLFLGWDEVDEVLELVKMLDFQELNRQQFDRLIVHQYEKGCLNKAQAFLPLHYLPAPLTSYRLNENMNSNIDEQFMSLYNDLRAYFSLNPKGYSAYALQVSTLKHSDRTFFGVTVELASTARCQWSR